MGRRTKHQGHRPSQNSLCVNISNRQRALPLSKRSIDLAVRELLAFLQVSCQEISLYFVGSEKIAALHHQFFNDPTTTDCITFPLDKEHLGEIFVCPQTAIEYAQKNDLDPYEETLLYIAHGILHLIGYDDIEPDQRRIMRKMEKRCMRHLRTRGISLAPISP